MSDEPFTIDAVDWHVKGPGAHVSPDFVRAWFRRIALFLQDNGLASRTLLEPGATVADDFKLTSADVTPEGLDFLRSQYRKWQKSLDRGGKIEATRLLEDELRKRRGKEGGRGPR